MSDDDTFDYAMPSLGADMDEGRVIEWRVAPGDTVHRGDLIAVVETEKSDIDIEIWHDGIVEEFLVDVGQLVDVGTPIARLRTVGAGAAPKPLRRPPRPDASAAPAPAPARRTGTSTGNGTGTGTGRSGPRLATRTPPRGGAGHRSRRGERQRTGRRGDRGGRRRRLGHRAGRRRPRRSDPCSTP